MRRAVHDPSEHACNGRGHVHFYAVMFGDLMKGSFWVVRENDLASSWHVFLDGVACAHYSSIEVNAAGERLQAKSRMDMALR